MSKAGDDRPALSAGINLADFQAHYYMRRELQVFARELGLSAAGNKPALTLRIERRLSGLPDEPRPTRRSRKTRDSDKPLTRTTAVINYLSDAKTRAFFEAEIGPEFHFTYRLNQFRLAAEGLTYGDLIGEWLAERERRRDPDYKAALAKHGKWNRFVRDFFADEHNKGRSLADAAELWRRVKSLPGDHQYLPVGRPHP